MTRRWVPHRHRPNGWTSTCSCGKRSYRTRGDAKAAARDYPRPRPGAYECRDHPGVWHLGHLPGSVVTGDQPRDQLPDPAPRDHTHSHRTGVWCPTCGQHQTSRPA